MNDKIQVANPDLLVACYAAILALFAENGIQHESRVGSGDAWKVIVYGSQNPDFLDLSQEYPSWTFAQTRDDPHMQSALVSAQSFVKNTAPALRDTKTGFDFEYERLKEKFGTDFGAFLQRAIAYAKSVNDEESYESSSEWASSAQCW